MKKRSREINVFSMSALDLFASALGAFILLTVIFIPFFPNTGDSTVRVAELTEKLQSKEQEVEKMNEINADANAWAEKVEELANARVAEAEELANARVAEAEAASSSVQQALDKLKNSPHVQFPPLDLVIALDTTGSMRDEVDGLRSEVAQLAELLMEMAPSVGIGVIDFKDRCEPNSVRAFDLTVINPQSLKQLQAFANTMSAGSYECNTDGPEAVGSALTRAVSMSWRPVSKIKVIVVITDNPAYPEEVATSLATASGFAARGPGSQVSVVSIRGEGEDYLRALANAGSGKYVSGGGSFATSLLLALAST